MSESVMCQSWKT